jgi:predicted  nucleic acid-binding Zn-ribbon protein
LTAALQAAKEAVGEQNKSNVLANTKSEAAFTKLIDQLSVLIDRTDKSLSDKIEDSKERIGVIEKNANERLTAMESHSKGSRDTSHDIWGYLVGFGGLVIAAIVLFMKATGH